MKTSDFVSAIRKVSIMSEYQVEILLQYYDSLNTQKINGTSFLEQLCSRDMMANSQAINIRNDVFPYLLHCLLKQSELQRLSKLQALFVEATSSLLPPGEESRNEAPSSPKKHSSLMKE